MEAADDEIEAVCSIWDSVNVEKIKKERRLTAKIHPLEDGTVSANVLVECRIFEGYPSVKPDVKLTNPRGICESKFEELHRQVDRIVAENIEMPIICEIFQHCCDFLTEHQHTNMDCSICLLALSDQAITVTSCQHFMHCDCFCRYLNECCRFICKEIDAAELPHLKNLVEKNVFCPICRENLTKGDDNDADFEKRIAKVIETAKRKQRLLPRPKRRISTTNDDLANTIRCWRKQQNRLAEMFQKQKKNGGIIDIEKDKKQRQFFIEASVPGNVEISEIDNNLS